MELFIHMIEFSNRLMLVRWLNCDNILTKLTLLSQQFLLQQGRVNKLQQQGTVKIYHYALKHDLSFGRDISSSEAIRLRYVGFYRRSLKH